MLPSGKDHTPPSKILEERNTVNTQLIMFPYAKDLAPMNKYQLNLGEEERNSVNLQTISSRPINSEVKSWANGMDKEHPNKVKKMSHSLNPFKVPSTHSSAPKKSNITVNSDIIMIMDSTGTHIDPNLLYPIEGSTDQKLFCPLLENVDELLEDSMFENIPTVTVLHCRTNNLDHADPRSVIENLTNTAKNLSKKLFSSKIIVSGILPRSDFEKSEIYTMDIELTKRLQFLPNVHFINHYSLLFRKSNVTLLKDKKHLNETGAKIFSKVLKDHIFGRTISRPSNTRQRSPSRERMENLPKTSRYEFPRYSEADRRPCGSRY